MYKKKKNWITLFWVNGWIFGLKLIALFFHFSWPNSFGVLDKRTFFLGTFLVHISGDGWLTGKSKIGWEIIEKCNIIYYTII